MANTHHTQGPGQRVLLHWPAYRYAAGRNGGNKAAPGRRGAGGGKSNLFQLLIMTGLTLLFAAFGLMSLLVLVIWAVDAQYRLNVMIATTVVLLLAAAIVGIWTYVRRDAPRCCA